MDLESARRMKQGDRETIAEFVRTFYPRIYRLMAHLTGNREDAEDLTQQAILRAKDNIGSFNGNSSLATWVHRVAFREYAQWKRRQRFIFRIPVNLSYREQAFEAVEDSLLILRALDRLPQRQREAFLLFEVQELTLEEVANIMRKPVGTVKSDLHFARKRLRELLLQDQEPSNDASRESKREPDPKHRSTEARALAGCPAGPDSSGPPEAKPRE